MTLNKAMNISKKGDIIIKKSWTDKRLFIKIISDGYYAYPFEFTEEELNAEDWEIVEEQICEECRIPQPVTMKKEKEAKDN